MSSSATNPTGPEGQDRTRASEPATPTPTNAVDSSADARPRTDSPEPVLAQREVEQRQREQFGGMKIGAAFFGWLTATGTAVILTTLIAAIAAVLGWTATVDPAQVAGSPQLAGLVGLVVLLVVVLVSYYCGGYVAGRMARFNGVKQGIGVWLWSVVIAIVLAGLSALAGVQADILGPISGLPRIPIDQSVLTATGVLTVLLVAAASLVGAILGGLAGMRFHRKVDRRTDLTQSG